MNELPDNNGDEARRWLGNIDDDLAAMRAVYRDQDSPARMTCFLAHLVVEKSLKTSLIDAGVPFGKTHALLDLHDTCTDVGRIPDVDRDMLKQLSPWSIDGRYADDLAEADRDLARRFAEFAAEVVDAVRSELGSGGDDQ